MEVIISADDVENLDDEEEVEEYLSDYITDETGFCHDGFDYDEIFVLEAGTKVYKVETTPYNGKTSITEVLIKPNHSHNLAWTDQYGDCSAVTEASEDNATADVTDLVTGRVREDQYIGTMETEKIKTTIIEGFCKINFGYMYLNRDVAVEDYNNHIQAEIDHLETMKLPL